MTSFFAGIRAKVQSFFTKLKRIFSKGYLRTLPTVVEGKFRKGLESMRPAGKRDYYPVFGWMIAKRMALAVLLAIVVFALAATVILLPNPSKKSEEIRSYSYKSIGLRFQTGKVKILDCAGNTAYVGDVSKGAASGTGTLYDKDKKLMYEGEFKNNMFNGEGKLYKDGHAVYTGSFLNNKRSGEGIEYGKTGLKLYEGSFREDMKNGEGQLFSPEGAPVFKGEFSADAVNYAQFTGCDTATVNELYTGPVTVFSQGNKFCVHMKAIDAMYYAFSDEEKLDDSVDVKGVYVLSSLPKIDGVVYSSIDEIKEVFGVPKFEGNTTSLFFDLVALSLTKDSDINIYADENVSIEEVSKDYFNVKSDLPSRKLFITAYDINGIRYMFFSFDGKKINMYLLESISS